MKKMKAKLTAVSVANKERNETPMVERETPNSPNIDNLTSLKMLHTSP